MTDPIRTVFETLLADMPDPPAWDEVSTSSVVHPAEQRKPPRSPHRRGVAVGLASAVALFALIAAPLILFGSGDQLPPSATGTAFAQPEHVRLRFSQQLTMWCDGMDTIDNDRFDRFDLEIWVDDQVGRARLQFTYPDGSTYDLMVEGRPGAWTERGWAKGTDLGRDAGCGIEASDGTYSQTIAGWVFQDSSPRWFEGYLQPVIQDGNGIIAGYFGTAMPGNENTYAYTHAHADGETRVEYILDEEGLRLVEEHRRVVLDGQFEADATIEVLETGPATPPAGIFDTSGLTQIWGDAVTTTSIAESELEADFRWTFNRDTTSGTHCPVVSMAFIDQSSGDPDSWEWAFPDGSTSNEQHPFVDYEIDGTVTLTVRSGSETDAVDYDVNSDVEC